MDNEPLRYLILGVLRSAGRPLTAEEIRRELERLGVHVQPDEQTPTRH